MPFDEEELDPHGECRAEIERLRTEHNELRAKERERVAKAVERLDNTMMNQDKLAAYIRNLLTRTKCDVRAIARDLGLLSIS